MIHFNTLEHSFLLLHRLLYNALTKVCIDFEVDLVITIFSMLFYPYC